MTMGGVFRGPITIMGMDTDMDTDMGMDMGMDMDMGTTLILRAQKEKNEKACFQDFVKNLRSS